MNDSVDGQVFRAGSTTTVRWLLANNLLDELRLLLHPVLVGSGQKLFAVGPGHLLELVEQQALSTGVDHLLYRPAT
jgi:dihydrofolate reductase